MFCTRCRNFAVQSDCRAHNYNILTVSETVDFVVCEKFVKCCIVAKIQKEFEKQSELGNNTVRELDSNDPKPSTY